jgi:hypothetical protein
MVVNTLPYGAWCRGRFLKKALRRGRQDQVESRNDDIAAGSVRLARDGLRAMQVPYVCLCCVCVCVCVLLLLLLLLLLLFVLRLNDVVAARSSAAFNNGNVDLVSAVVGGDVTPWCESAWLFGRLR